MDKITKEQRSKNMSRIKSKDTSLEKDVRKVLYSKGLRYRLHYKLPGKPDIVFIKRKIAIFLHGCFWHGHTCKKGVLPTSNVDFWSKKIEGNKTRDERNYEELKSLGWKVFNIWECEQKEQTVHLIKFLKTD